MDSQNFKKSLTIILISLLVYLPITFVINAFFRLMNYNNERALLAAYYSMYYQIKKSAEDTGQIPKTISDLPGGGKFVHYYNPDAWRKSGRILLWYQLGYSYGVTFGDGNQAILIYWKKRPFWEETLDKSDIAELRPRSLPTSKTNVITSGVIAILVTCFVSNKFLSGSKKAVVPKAD
jgi:hypothetical protein